MDISTYQSLAMRTVSPAGRDGLPALQNAALGLAGEFREFADIIKKASFQGHQIDSQHLSEEVGDILWYCALAASALGKDLGQIAADNVEKLRRRYPNGFEQERSLHREE